MIFENGMIYVGEWTDGKIQGEGTMTYPSKTVYTGQWVSGKRRKTFLPCF